MQVGDLVKWADGTEFCGIVIGEVEKADALELPDAVLIWFRYGGGQEWCFTCDLEVVCK